MYTLAPGAVTSAFDCGDFHPACPGVVAIPSPASGRGVVLWCPACRVLADAEAVAKRVTYESSLGGRS